LRTSGTPWGALVAADTETEAKSLANALIQQKKNLDPDWAYLVSRKNLETIKGKVPKGPRVAIIDFGVKENTIRELAAQCSEVGVFPSRTPEKTLRDWNPDGIMLSNGPGDPADVKEATETLRSILGWKPVFGICMGNQILARALGAKTYKLPFGHRGGNHPVKDLLLNEIYVTSQNHGYCVDASTLPKEARVTQFNLNDGTVEGIECLEKKCFSVQYHPESHPGPHEARKLFDYFLNGL
ncbi:MAG: carbamoyl phosphate synthase small subunit, partial [Bdellovibrionota bacterium]